jgi:hypothetical protein
MRVVEHTLSTTSPEQRSGTTRELRGLFINIHQSLELLKCDRCRVSLGIAISCIKPRLVLCEELCVVHLINCCGDMQLIVDLNVFTWH